jgi:DtxR family transcriptional regulator, Mn-dependent transcriptional regulator
MKANSLSPSIEMYLKSLVQLDAHEPVAISRLAQRMGVSQVSANEMVKRMADQGLATHILYKGVQLTPAGRLAGYNVMRRQRLWECFLYQHLGIEWGKVYDLACDLEHATDPEVTEALSEFLGQPHTCPHGNPIPGADGSFTPLDGVPLSELGVGQSGYILSVSASNSEVLRHLAARYVFPGKPVSVLEAAPLQGPLTLQMDGHEVALGLQVAEYVLVKPDLAANPE